MIRRRKCVSCAMHCAPFRNWWRFVWRTGVGGTFRDVMQKVLRKVLRTVANHDPDYYDMYLDPNEAFFAKLYVKHIMRHAAEAGIHPQDAAGGGSLRPRILEAGCQAGRLVVPFAKLGFDVT